MALSYAQVQGIARAKIPGMNHLVVLASSFALTAASCGLGSDGLTSEAISLELQQQGFIVEPVADSPSLVCLVKNGVANIVSIEARSGLAEVTSDSLNEEDIAGWGTIVVWESDEARVTYFSTPGDDQVDVGLTEVLGPPIASGGTDASGGTAPSPAAACDEALRNL